MRKNATKKKVATFKPRSKKRQCLTEIPYNSIEARHPLRKRILSLEIFEVLPCEVIIHILLYLEPKDLVSSCQLVNKYWRNLCNTPVLWKRPLMHIDLR